MWIKIYMNFKKLFKFLKRPARGILLVAVLCLWGLSLTANDICTNAITVTCGSTTAGTTVGATFDGVGFCGTNNTAPGVWYHFVGSGDDVITLSTCSASTNYDTKISVFSGSCGSLTCIDGNDDGSDCSFSNVHSTLFFNVSVGVDYYILVHGFGSATGSFELSLDCMPRPANDDICDYQPLTIGVPIGFSNIGSTAQMGEPNPGEGSVGPSPTCDAVDGWCSFELTVQRSVWFGFVATSNCVDIVVTGDDLQLAVWQAPGGCTNLPNLVEVGANDDGGPGLAPALFGLDVSPGLFYFVQIDGFGTTVTNNATIVVNNSNACVPPIPPCTSELTTLTINLDNFPGETTWELHNDDGDLIAEGGPYVTPGGTVVEQLCSDPDCYEFTIFDSFGDGICCGFGNGSYEVTDPNGNVVASGGNFGSSQTSATFCTTCETALMPPWFNADIGAANGASFFNQCNDGFIAESQGFNSSPLSDVQHFGYQELCGDVEIIVKVEGVINPGHAGIQIRETLSPGSRKVALKTQLNNFIRRDVRVSPNGFVQSQQYPRYGHTWLRLVRSGNLFFGFTSLNGTFWQPLLQTMLPMNTCAYVGFYAEGVNNITTTTASFSNLSLTGPAPLQEDDGLDLAFEGLELAPGYIDGDIHLYPNPSSSEVNVELGNLSGKTIVIQAFNELGQEVISKAFDSASSVESIPVNNLKTGIYFMKVSSDNLLAPKVVKFQVIRP